MTFVPFSLLNKELTDSISSNSEKVDKELFKKPILPEPVLITKTFGEYSDLPLTPLNDIFEEPNHKETVFRTRFYVIKVTPNEVENFVENYVPSSGSSSVRKSDSRERPAYKVSF